MSQSGDGFTWHITVKQQGSLGRFHDDHVAFLSVAVAHGSRGVQCPSRSLSYSLLERSVKLATA